MNKCPRCKVSQPESKYNYRKSGSRQGKRITPCKDCIYANARENRVKHYYGITLEQYEELLASQGFRCAICGTSDPGHQDWAIDHDHNCCPEKKSCGKCVRGLLCNLCNAGLGMFRDSTRNLVSAINYLENR